MVIMGRVSTVLGLILLSWTRDYGTVEKYKRPLGGNAALPLLSSEPTTLSVPARKDRDGESVFCSVTNVTLTFGDAVSFVLRLYVKMKSFEATIQW